MKKLIALGLMLLAIPAYGADTKGSALADGSASVAGGHYVLGYTTTGPASRRYTIDSILGLKTSVSGNAGTATALAADPAGCSGGQVTTDISAGGVATCTAWGANTLTLMGGVDFAAWRTSLGLVIGTNVQAYNSNLTAINQALTNTSNPAFSTLNLVGAGLTVGTGSTTSGLLQIKNATNNNIFTVQPGATGAALSWTLPIAAPGGTNYLLNVDADGVMGYTDPASFGGGSMTWPSTAGIAYWTSGTAWGGAYNATTKIPANYVTDSHSAATIGTANGLSFSDQALSLALASTSTNGALSSTDWNTFNGKQAALTNPVVQANLGTGVYTFLGTPSIANFFTALTGEGAFASTLMGYADAAAVFTGIKQAASDTATGVVELATTAEATTGTDTVRAVTPAGVKAVTDQFWGTGGDGINGLSFDENTATFAPSGSKNSGFTVVNHVPQVYYSAGLHSLAQGNVNFSGTLTNTYLCTFATGGAISCNTNPASFQTALTNPLVAGTMVTGNYCTKNATSNTIDCNSAGTGSMTYPGAGIPQSTGSAWGTSITAGTGVVTALGNAVNASGGVLTSAATVGNLTASTSAAVGVGTVELGHASDTTIARASAGVATIEGVAIARIIANGTSALGTSAIASGACATAVTTTATGTATTDVINWGFNGDPTGVTGYAASANGMLTIIAYPSSGNVNYKVCNNTAASITPGAITLNWQVIR